MLYKRPFRKGKEVVTFLIKDKMIKSAWNLRIEPCPYQSEATQWALGEGASLVLPPYWHRQDAQDACPDWKKR